MIKKWLLMAISAVLIWLGVGINQSAYASVDFDSIPLSELRFSYDGFNVHQWGMVMDGDKIALVLNMNPKGTGRKGMVSKVRGTISNWRIRMFTWIWRLVIQHQPSWANLLQ